MKDYFRYKFESSIDFSTNKKDFITILGNNNDYIIDTLESLDKSCEIYIKDEKISIKDKENIKEKMHIITHKTLEQFDKDNVLDELTNNLTKESKKLIEEKSELYKIKHLLDKDPYDLSTSDKVKIKIIKHLVQKPNIFIINNLISELDYNDKKLIFDMLQEYSRKGGIVLNFTNDIEESLYSKKIIIIYDKSLACEGKTLSVLNEEKLLKRLGIGLPFIIELNKYFMDYGMIDKYYLTNEELVSALWK